MAISVSDLSNITDTYETDTIDFTVTALLFEGISGFAITNRYMVSDGSKTANGAFNGTWISEAGISIPQDSLFVTIAVPNDNLTVTQKLVVNYFNEKTQKTAQVTFDLVVNYIS